MAAADDSIAGERPIPVSSARPGMKKKTTGALSLYPSV
jgi:hypothetical protein